MSERRHVLTKVRVGDYICLSNDESTLWRFTRYEDGRVLGLECDFDVKEFWWARRTPWSTAERLLDHSEVDDLPWEDVRSLIPTRREALEMVTG